MHAYTYMYLHLLHSDMCIHIFTPTYSTHAYTQTLVGICLGPHVYPHSWSTRNCTYIYAHTNISNYILTHHRSIVSHYILQFSTDLWYVKGKNNAVADTVWTEIDTIEDDTESVFDSWRAEIRFDTDTFFKFQESPAPFSDKTLYKALLDLKFLLHPEKKVFRHLHGLSRPSKQTMVKVNGDHFMWLNIYSDVQEWVSTRLECQKRKLHRHTKSLVSTFSNPGARFFHIHADLVGSFLMCRSYQYLLTVVDRFSRWLTAVPIKNTSISKAILKNWIMTFDIPQMVTTDREAQFQSFIFREFTHLLSASNIKTANHSSTDGLVEEFYRSLKTSLATGHNTTNWVDDLLLALRNTWKKNLVCSPVGLVFSIAFSLPG